MLKTSSFTKGLSIFLSLLFIFYAIPISALKDLGEVLEKDLPVSESVYEETNEIDEVSIDDIDAIGEIIALRESNVKHFRMSDGSYTATTYAQTIHFKDENNLWQDIDNTLSFENTTNGKKGGNYSATQGKTNIRFAQTSTDRQLLQLSDGENKISFGFEQSFIQKTNLNTVTAVVENPKTVLEKNDVDDFDSKSNLERLSELTNITSKILYPDVLPNTDIEYILSGTDIKENIIVKKSGGAYEYAFLLNIGTLLLEEAEDGSIQLNDSETGETKYHIPAPFMFDVNDDFSTDVKYIIEQLSEGEYRLTVEASQEWINHPDRTFPVTIDPVLRKGGYSSAVIDDVYVIEGQPNTKVVNDTVLYCGYDSDISWKRMRVYWKINQLPELPSSSIIIDAQISLGQLNTNGYSGYSGLNLGIREAKSSWTRYNLSWNTQPNVGSLIYDYNITSTAKNGANLLFNITSLAQSWYSGDSANHGVAIYPITEYNGSGSVLANARFKSSYYTGYYSALAPMFYVAYRDSKGLEDRWTYQEHGLSGVNGYVNHYTGNLVLVTNGISTKGLILPITINHVYNTYLANQQFNQSPSNISAPLTYDFSNMKIGYGWKLSIQETIVEKTIDNTLYYVYNDADGTELYFLRNVDGDIVSEDGYALKIIKNANSTYTLIDDFGNKKGFSANGKISYLSDNLGNSQSFSYDSSGRITSIITYRKGMMAGVSSVNLTYNASGALTRVTNASDPSEYIDYYYSQTFNGTVNSTSYNYLRQIVPSKGGTVYFYYNAVGTINYIYSYDDSNRIYYEYISPYNAIGEKTYRVSKVYHSDNFTNVGQTVGFSYAAGETTLRTSGTNDTYGDSDDILNTYVFDNSGRTVNVYSTNLNKTVTYGTSATVYNNGKPSNGSERRNNTIAAEVITGAPAVNLLKDGSFEGNANWSSYASTGNQNIGITDMNTFIGDNLCRMGSSSTSGYANYYQSVKLTAGKTYTMSAYVRATNISGYGAYIALGNVQSEKITGTTNTSIQNGWQRISVTFTPASTANYYADLYLYQSTGTVYFDCIQVEEGEGPSSFNIVENGSCEQGYGWSTDNGTSYSIAYARNEKSLKISSLVTAQRFSSQTLQVYLPVKTTFVLSGWAKADSADLEVIPGDPVRTFKIIAKLTYNNGMTEEVDVCFNPDVRVWQFASGPIVAKNYGNATMINTIKLELRYDFNINTAYFDDISLIAEPVQTYAYDYEGNLISTKDALGNSDGLQYAANKVDLEKYTAINGAVYNYTYRSVGGVNTHQVASVYRYDNPLNTSSNKITTAYTYNEQGGVTGTSTTSSQLSGKSITTSTAYTSYGNLLASTTDARGKTTNYNYNNSSGLLTYVQDPNGNRIYYNYDSRQRLQNVFLDANKNGVFEASEVGIGYTYNSKNQLSAITTPSTTYSFAYNSFGNASNIGIAGRPSLASYTYNSYNGKLKRTTYGNGFYVENDYDHLDRVVGIKYNGTTKFTFAYNGDGGLHSKTDLANNTTTYYEYDSLGRLIRGREMSGSTLKLGVENQFDSYGRKVL